MGSNDSENADVDARTTYRATNGGVPSYDEPKREPLYNSDEAPAYEEEPSYGAEPTKRRRKRLTSRPRKRRRRKPRPPSRSPSPKRSRRPKPRQRRGPEPEKPSGARRRRPAKPKKEEAADAEEEDDLSELRARDIQLEERAGISEDVRRYMSGLRDDYNARSRASSEDEPAEKSRKKKKAGSAFGFMRRGKKEEGNFDLEEDAFDTSDIPDDDEIPKDSPEDYEADYDEADDEGVTDFTDGRGLNLTRRKKPSSTTSSASAAKR